MTYSNDEDIRLTRAKLAQSRAEILAILDPPPGVEATEESAAGEGFPRSRTMKMLLSGRGMGTVGALVGGLVIARPALALRLVRMLPAGAVARMLLIKAVSKLRLSAKRPRARRADPEPPNPS